MKCLLLLSPLSRCYTLKLLAETCVQRRCQISFSRRCIVKLFPSPVARQVSRKVEWLSTSATACNGHSGENTRVSSCNTTSWNWFRSLLSRYVARANHKPGKAPLTTFHVPKQVSTFNVTRCNACLFLSIVAHKFQPKVSTCTCGFRTKKSYHDNTN